MLRTNYADHDARHARCVATEIAKLVPRSVWMLITDIENTGREEFVYRTKEAALNVAASILKNWLSDFDYSDQPLWTETKRAIAEMLRGGQVEEAIGLWTKFQEPMMDAEAEMFVSEYRLD
jgi:hypothetical protein